MRNLLSAFFTLFACAAVAAPATISSLPVTYPQDTNKMNYFAGPPPLTNAASTIGMLFSNRTLHGNMTNAGSLRVEGSVSVAGEQTNSADMRINANMTVKESVYIRGFPGLGATLVTATNSLTSIGKMTNQAPVHMLSHLNVVGNVTNELNLRVNQSSLIGVDHTVLGYTYANGGITSGGSIIKAGFLGGYALVSDISGDIVESATSDTAIGYLQTVTSDIQPQLDGKVDELAGVATNLTVQQLTVGTNLQVNGQQTNTHSLIASNFYGANFIRTNGFPRASIAGWGGTNVQWRMVKNITLTNVTDVSAAAYYPSNNTFFTIHNNNNGRVTEWTLDGVFVRKIDWTAGQITDAESVTYLGGNKFGIIEEDSNRIIIFTVTNGAGNVTISTNGLQIVQLSTSIAVDPSVSGVEGVCFDWDRDGWWVAHEKSPAQLLFVSKDGATTNNWFSTAQMQTFTNANHTDFSDVFLDRDNQILWVTQDEGGAGQFDRVIGISLITSNVIATINMTNFGQLEGVSLTTDGKLLVAGEVNQFAIFEPVLGGLNTGISWVNAPDGRTNDPAMPIFPYGFHSRSNISVATTVIVTNGVGHQSRTIAGAGSGSTNFTQFAWQNTVFLGNSNVNIVASMPGLTGLAYDWDMYVTNLSANTWGIQFSAVTNEWSFWNYNYGTNPPVVLTNSYGLHVKVKQVGTNCYGEYNYYRPIKP